MFLIECASCSPECLHMTEENLCVVFCTVHLLNMSVITHPWESENGFVKMGPTHVLPSVVWDSREKESFFPFHYIHAYTIMKVILIGFNACRGARSCYLMAPTEEYEYNHEGSFRAGPLHTLIIPSSMCLFRSCCWIERRFGFYLIPSLH